MEPERGYWFQQNSQPEGLPPQGDLKTDHERFRQRLSHVINKGDQNVPIVKSTKDDLIKQIEEVRDPPPRQTSAIQLLRRASAAHNKYAIDRRQGFRSWAWRHSEVLLTFVEKFSKVIEAVATAGGPYSTIAYETLSILVVQNKVNNDNKVVDLLDEIRKSLPRLENWENIYPTKTMRSLVVSIYLHITKFSKKAAEYFTHSWKRHKLALFPGFVTGFDEIGTEIRTVLADINNEAMYGLHQRTQHIFHQNDESGRKIEYLKERADKAELIQQELHAQNRELLAQNESLKLELEQQRFKSDIRDRQEDERRLRAFSELLEVPLNHPGTKVAATKEALMEVFPDLPPNPSLVPYTGYIQASRDLLYNSPEYRRWHDAKEPSLMFISGCTDWYGRKDVGFLHCWLSPFTIYIAEDASREENNAIVAFFSGLPNVHPKAVSANMIIASVILQIIQKCPHLLREHADEFRWVLKKMDTSWSTESLVSLLGEVLLHLGNSKEGVAAGPIYIVIDRLDCCIHDNIPRVMEHLSTMITRLKHPSSITVKLAVIAETSEGNAQWHTEWLSKFDYDFQRLIVRHDWDQEKIPSWLSLTDYRPLIWRTKSAPSARTL